MIVHSFCSQLALLILGQKQWAEAGGYSGSFEAKMIRGGRAGCQ
jgi:hypothetical protein